MTADYQRGHVVTPYHPMTSPIASPGHRAEERHHCAVRTTLGQSHGIAIPGNEALSEAVPDAYSDTVNNAAYDTASD